MANGKIFKNFSYKVIKDVFEKVKFIIFEMKIFNNEFVQNEDKRSKSTSLGFCRVTVSNSLIRIQY